MIITSKYIRRMVVTGGFIGIGIALSILVAWGCAYWSHVPDVTLDYWESDSSETDPTDFYERSLDWRSGRPDHFPEKPLWIARCLPGKGVRQTEMAAMSGPSPYFDEEISFEEMSDEEFEALEWPTHYQLRVVASGWPMHSLRACVWEEGTTQDIGEWEEWMTGGLQVGGAILPLQLQGWGMLVSAIFWGGLSYLGYRRVAVFRGDKSPKTVEPTREYTGSGVFS